MSNPSMKIDFHHVTSRKNKDGSTRYYFRRRGFPTERLPNDPKSTEFAKAYDRLLNWVSDEGIFKYGTFGWACDEYMKSLAYTTKAISTQTARLRIIEAMKIEHVDPDYPEIFGNERLKGFDESYIEVLRDRKAEVPNAANERLKILNQIFKLMVRKKIVTTNPVDRVEKFTVISDGHATASDDHIDQYFKTHTSGTAYTAMMFLTEYGMRVSDLVDMGKKNVKGDTLCFTTKKTGMLCELPISDDFKMPNELYFILNENGKPFSNAKVLSARISKWFIQAGIKGITAHSVRKWLACKKAELGWSEIELMAWFGWRDGKEARPYVQAASRRKLAKNAQLRTGRV